VNAYEAWFTQARNPRQCGTGNGRVCQLPLSALLLPLREKVAEGRMSGCVVCQVFFGHAMGHGHFQVVLFLTMVLRTTRSFRMQAVRMTLAGFPFCLSR